MEMPVDGLLRSTPAAFYPSKLFAKTRRRRKTEVLIETFIRKQLRLKAHTVTQVEETAECMLVHIDRLGGRLLRCGVCRQRCQEVHDVRKERTWRDLSMRKLPLKLVYQPRRVECPRCGVRVEDFPWAEPWARVTTALANAVARLARALSWQGTARQYGLNWKSVATIVKRAVQYGLAHRVRPPVHVMGIDEVSRRKGQVYLTVVYDLERRVLLWVGEDRTEEAVKKFFTEEMGRRRCRTLQVVCMDMWAAYAKLVREHAPNAQILFDRFHIVKHLNEAVEEVRRSEMRRLSAQEKVPFKRSRWLLLKNPWNLPPRCCTLDSAKPRPLIFFSMVLMVCVSASCFSLSDSVGFMFRRKSVELTVVTFHTPP